MTEEEHRKLRGYYHSLRGLERVFREQSRLVPGPVGLTVTVIDQISVRILSAEIERIEKDFPGLLAPFNADTHIYRGREFHVTGILSYLAVALGKMEIETEGAESAPVTQNREFSFVTDTDLRRLLERDYQEIQRAYIAKCWKSVIVLSGGAIEAMLLARLQRHPNEVKSAKSAPTKPDVTKWDLSDLINVCVDQKYIGQGAEKLSHPVREYRNLIHPGNEIRNKLIFGAEEAKIALEVLHIVHRDLSM